MSLHLTRPNDPRQNAPASVSTLHGDARTAVHYRRAEARRLAHLREFERVQAIQNGTVTGSEFGSWKAWAAWFAIVFILGVVFFALTGGAR